MPANGIVILGAGPTGLGAAYRLQQLGSDDVTVVEASSGPGGLAASVLDERGFTWDLGGHVQFSHYRYYDEVMDLALGDQWLEHERQAWIWMKGRFVPYPFQYNLRWLDPGDCEQALAGLETAAGRQDPSPPRHFGEWVEATFGEWISTEFLVPYNRKVWGYPLEQLGVGWVGERVAVPDLARVRRNVSEQRDDVGWGPNRRFRFPLRGGTGAIWRAVAGLVAPDFLRYGREAVAVDLHAKTVRLDNGETLGYRSLVTTLPLDRFAALCHPLDDTTRSAAASLVHSTCHVVGVGLRGDMPATLQDKCWMYFPEPASPYYRVTVFSKYSPFNVPAGDGYWSLMAEVCETPWRPVAAEGLLEWTVSALRADGLLGPDSEVVSLWHRRLEYGYPTPSLGRDAALDRVLPALEERGVYSRGRFGAWKYEVSNQDHAFMQGVEVADRILGTGEEPTLRRPQWVNSGALSGPVPASGSRP